MHLFVDDETAPHTVRRRCNSRPYDAVRAPVVLKLTCRFDNQRIEPQPIGDPATHRPDVGSRGERGTECARTTSPCSSSSTCARAVGVPLHLEAESLAEQIEPAVADAGCCRWRRSPLESTRDGSGPSGGERHACTSIVPSRQELVDHLPEYLNAADAEALVDLDRVLDGADHAAPEPVHERSVVRGEEMSRRLAEHAGLVAGLREVRRVRQQARGGVEHRPPAHDHSAVAHASSSTHTRRRQR